LQEIIQTYIKNLAQYSPECTKYLIGNKSDLIKPEDSEILLNSIRQYQIEGFPIIFVSAKTQGNISEAFSLVVFNFLKKIENESKDKQFLGISKRFLESINKNEEELEHLIINLEEIEPNTIHNKISPTIIKKNVKMAESEVFPLSEIKDLTKNQEFDVDKSLIKENIIIAFKNNLSIISDLISDLKKAPIDSLISDIDKSLEDLSNLKNDFELKLDLILELESNKQKS